MSDAKPPFLSEEEEQTLLKISRFTLEKWVKEKKYPSEKDLRNYQITAALEQKAGVFVSLHKMGELRGCIGYILPILPLYQTVIEMAQSAALHDPRFSPVSPAELKNITVEISVLTVPETITDPSVIEVGKHGIIMKRGYSQGLLLPQVATDYGWDRETFLEHTCLKAGLPRNAWQDKNTEIQIFSAQVFNRETVRQGRDK